MSFYSYKNANADASPGTINGNPMDGICEKICVQVKNIYDACLQQEQLDNKEVTVTNIVPVLSNTGCMNQDINRSCRCDCSGNQCNCRCGTCGEITYQDALENAENATCLPQPCGTWTFESCRSSTTCGVISNLVIDRLCDRPQFARVKGTVSVPIDVLFTDQNCQEWMGRAELAVNKDVLLAIPDESIVPFTLESMVSAICVSGSYQGSCQFKINICVTVILKVLAEVELMVPSYGFCSVPPCEEFAENVCDEFFSLPLFPQSNCSDSTGTAASASTCTSCGSSCVNNLGQTCAAGGCTSCGTSSTCSSCGTTCAGCSTQCPRCGSTMTRCT